MMNFMGNPIHGVSYFLDGFELITRPGLRRFIIIPVIINLVLFVILFFLYIHFIDRLESWFIHFLPYWLTWLAPILWFLFLIGFILIFIYLFVTLVNIIAAPFNALLAEKVELYLTGRLKESRSLFGTIKDAPRSILRQVAIFVYYLPRAIFLLVLFFVPGVQIAAPLLWFLFNAWFQTLTYVDYPTDNHRISLVAARSWLGEHRGLSLGFGVGVLIATSIPVLNLFAIPAAVCGATKLWLEEARP
jgi:CysZ protein